MNGASLFGHVCTKLIEELSEVILSFQSGPRFISRYEHKVHGQDIASDILVRIEWSLAYNLAAIVPRCDLAGYNMLRGQTGSHDTEHSVSSCNRSNNTFVMPFKSESSIPNLNKSKLEFKD